MPSKYTDTIISHILDGLEYEAIIMELGYSLCKIRCRLISKEESELKNEKKRESLRIELTKPYNPKKSVTVVFVMKKRISLKVGNGLNVEFDDLELYVQGEGNIKFLNQAGDVVGIFDYDNMDKMRRLIKAHFNSFLFNIEVLDIEKERNIAWKGYLTKLLITPYKK